MNMEKKTQDSDGNTQCTYVGQRSLTTKKKTLEDWKQLRII